MKNVINQTDQCHSIPFWFAGSWFLSSRTGLPVAGCWYFSQRLLNMFFSLRSFCPAYFARQTRIASPTFARPDDCRAFRPSAGAIPISSQSRLASILLIAISLAVSPRVYADGAIDFLATDLTDTTPGQDLWRFTYSLSGFTFQANQGFSIFFDYLSYANLQNPTPNPSSSWSTIAVQPDVLLHEDGFFDAQALANSPLTSIPFSVDVIWLGTGTPGPQIFYTYDANFTPIFSGSTSVPEPQPWMLSGLAAACVVSWRVFQNRKKSSSTKLEA